MENKDEFLEKVTRLFHLNGAKSLTVDDIAQKFGMSKKTLYQSYKNKEELLMEVLEFNFLKIYRLVSALQKDESLNPVESLMKQEKAIQEMMDEKDSVFICQLHKYYPNVFFQHQTAIAGRITDLFRDNLEKGIVQGLYRNDFNKELYIKFILQIFFSIKSSPLFEEIDSKNWLCCNAVEFYVRAIATEKGLVELNKIKNIYEEMV